jgi:hypothetical protein
MGFQQGRATQCIFTHEERDLDLVVHGDDFTTLGFDKNLDWFEAKFKAKFEIKIRGRLGGGVHHDKEIRILNRVARWTKSGLEYEADQRHGEILVQELGLQNATPAITPGTKDKKEDRTEGDKELSPQDATRYRALAARANYLSQDRPDISFACKEICREMSKPTQAGMDKIRRLARYLKGQPRIVYRYTWQNPSDIQTYVDSDWAGCWKTRKSTSGGMAMIGEHLVKHWATTQPTIALSSGEAELSATIKGATQSLGIQSLAADMRMECQVHVHTDSRAGKAIASRKGLGKVRHLEVADLWIQDATAAGRLQLHKVEGAKNPADILTKYVERQLIEDHCARSSATPRAHRADVAPRLAA